MKFIKYTSKDTKIYNQSITLRNRDLYGSIGMAELSEEGKEIEKNNYFFGILDSDKLIGTVSFFDVKENHLQLVAMAIDNNYQGKGLGSKLVNYAISELIKEKKNDFIITTNGRKTAANFYHRLGFLDVGEEKIDPTHNGSIHIPMMKKVKI